MTENAKSKMTPRIRFPEFRHLGEWKEARLSQLGNLVSGLTYSPSDVREEGMLVLRSSNIQDGEIALHDCVYVTPDIANANLAQFNDILICVRNGSKSLIGKSALIPRGMPLCTHGAFMTVFRADAPDFVFQWMQSAAFQKQVAADLGATINSINGGHLLKYVLLIPEPDEQNRIADCLASLDDCIASQRRKVELLKAHKRGLLQELFPGKGEIVPRLRFPEFCESGKWVHRELGSMTSKIGSGITPLGGEKTYKPSGRPFIRSQNVGWGHLLLDDVAFLDEVIHASFDGTEIHEYDVLLNITGASIGRSAVADSRIVGGNVNQHVCIIRVKGDDLNPIFLNQLLISERGQSQIDSFQAGGNRQGLNFPQIRRFEIPLPPTTEEQDRIADCLFTQDSRIAAESQKLEALFDFKKGLLQKLFPSQKEER